MQKINNTSIYLGNMYDYEDVRDVPVWSALHCCKDPYHKELVGYKGNLSPEHINYSYIISGKRMALNIVDSDKFDKKYLDFFANMFNKSFIFLDRELAYKQKVIIHCNEGMSRSPMITLLYLGYRGIDGYNNLDFESALDKFIRENNLSIKPKNNIYFTSLNLWNKITK